MCNAENATRPLSVIAKNLSSGKAHYEVVSLGERGRFISNIETGKNEELDNGYKLSKYVIVVDVQEFRPTPGQGFRAKSDRPFAENGSADADAREVVPQNGRLDGVLYFLLSSMRNDNHASYK